MLAARPLVLPLLPVCSHWLYPCGNEAQVEVEEIQWLVALDRSQVPLFSLRGTDFPKV